MTNIAIVWVKKYSDADTHGLDNADKAAQGFACATCAKLVFDLHEGDANDELFQGESQAAVEAAHLVYFAGHGSEEGLLFSDRYNDNGVASHEDMRLGSGGLAFAVFDCCAVLTEFGRWKKVFDGLHYMLGFHRNNIQLSPDRGRRFAEILRTENPKPSIAEAWMRASLETGGIGMPWRVLRAVAEQDTTEDEAWSDEDPPEPGPRPPFAITSRAEVLENVDRVPLFRTPLPAESDARLAALAPHFGVSPESQPPHGGWKASRSDGPWLEVAEGSDSMWYIGRRPPARKIFEPPGSLPDREEAITKADAFLLTAGIGDDRLAHPTVSITEEIHERPYGPPGPRWIAERHVNYTWALDGLPVFGAGAKIRVTFAGPEIDGLLRFWREPVKELPGIKILTPVEAEGILRNDSNFTEVGTRLTIQHWDLGYLALPPTVEQDYLLPVYRFEGTAASPGLTQDFVRYVQAVPEEVRYGFSESSSFRLGKVL